MSSSPSSQDSRTESTTPQGAQENPSMHGPETGRDVREAPVMEVFASLQGEGKYLGQPQVFLRLAGCPLRCAWCDTPGSWKVREGAKVRISGVEEVRKADAWATPLEALTWVGEVEPGEPRPISITGGEPLLWPGFILGLASMVGERPLHLETAGAHPEALQRVLHAVAHVSLDLKLPADLGPVEELVGYQVEESAPDSPMDWADVRQRCLNLVADMDACAKVVVSGGRSCEDYLPLFEDLSKLAPKLPLYLQPVTPMGGVEAPGSELLLELCEMARDLEIEVRVVPQVHRLMGLP